MQRKAQAALEFLMTYGWAILAAIIVIGVLAYFGVFSPGRYATQSCLVTAPFYCDQWNAKASAGVSLALKNNGGETYNITSVVVAGCGTYSTPTEVVADATATITVACSPVLVEGKSFKGDVTINYRKAGGTLDLTSTGSVAQKVTA